MCCNTAYHIHCIYALTHTPILHTQSVSRSLSLSPSSISFAHCVAEEHSIHCSYLVKFKMQSHINISPFSGSSQSLPCTHHCPIPFCASFLHTFDRYGSALPRTHVRLSHFRTSPSRPFSAFPLWAAHDMEFLMSLFHSSFFSSEFRWKIYRRINSRCARNRAEYQIEIQWRANSTIGSLNSRNRQRVNKISKMTQIKHITILVIINLIFSLFLWLIQFWLRFDGTRCCQLPTHWPAAD